MKLSIITINLNNRTGLIRTMDSVFNQVYKDFEYIVIDGGSTDGSQKVIADYASRFILNLDWISEPDSGVFNAMNKGIVRAKGDYLLFLNSGDFLIEKDVLNAVFSKEQVADIISCRCRVSKNGEQLFVTTPPSNYTFGYFYNNSLAHQATFIKKALFDKLGHYREDMKLMSDWEFFIKAIIVYDATISNSEIVLSDYNMEGLSSLESNQDVINKEKQLVFEEKVFKSFILDYKLFYQNNQEKIMMEWAWNKKLFRLFIRFIYKRIANHK